MWINEYTLQYNVEWNKLNKKEFMQFNSTFIKFKYKQNDSWW